MFDWWKRRRRDPLDAARTDRARWLALAELRSRHGATSREFRDRLLEHRLVLVQGLIDDSLATTAISELLFLDNRDPRSPVSVFMDSPGGVMTAAAALVDTFEKIEPSVETIVPEIASGAALWLLAAGAPGLRRVGKNAKLMFTPLRSPAVAPAYGELAEAEKRRLEDLWVSSLEKHTGRSRDEVRSMLTRHQPFDAETAVAWGLADERFDERSGRRL